MFAATLLGMPFIRYTNKHTKIIPRRIKMVTLVENYNFFGWSAGLRVLLTQLSVKDQVSR